ncbi:MULTISPECIES: DUF2225 domain-containing protein [Anoxybacillus]|uniref:DUF2225 domain-containing protein n=1 Tax=Anoxybacillus flavithermus TaxID=33934 RepID=A0A178T8U4_9BACL|nr:DUF2225 domain-containing protein [Anoxybacillus flavithermus]ASA96771.1 hypothetical protein CA592_08080 [Anoxybacillus flavithermus]ELK21062.1 hypothetical protein, DUF2225 family [Anoxybacillus flavithermus TNO-09.006]MBE2905249.1 DUF2225 domain-containing protein [Anoxybacillus flavithermus]MBE2908596.1 DUF2225 domain-containing protein [Anoxybacillus flavithermus]MBE2910860.1 DUF2225 domain-containing protein [Anoxybacillus flavithermus]
MDVLYDRTVTCLVCKQTYTTKKVRSRFIRPVQHDTDFCSYYASEEANPLLYYVHVCPHCGFAATEEFSTETDAFIHTHMSEVRLLYLIGELYRRLGKEKQAVIYFSRVIARKKETIEKGIVNMAYDRWQEIREEKKGAQ